MFQNEFPHTPIWGQQTPVWGQQTPVWGQQTPIWGQLPYAVPPIQYQPIWVQGIQQPTIPTPIHAIPLPYNYAPVWATNVPTPIATTNIPGHHGLIHNTIGQGPIPIGATPFGFQPIIGR